MCHNLIIALACGCRTPPALILCADSEEGRICSSSSSSSTTTITTITANPTTITSNNSSSRSSRSISSLLTVEQKSIYYCRNSSICRYRAHTRLGRQMRYLEEEMAWRQRGCEGQQVG